MNDATAAVSPARNLSHVEIVHRPGERDLVGKFLGLLGVETQEAMGGQYVVGVIDRATYRRGELLNFLGGSEVDAEQWAFDQALLAAITDGPLGGTHAAYEQHLDRYPTRGMHIGIVYSSIAEWEEVIGRVDRCARDLPELADRVRLCGVYRPGEPDSVARFHQAFVWTDVVASGSLALGQRFELSALNPA
jgi:hypothetical protein